MYERNANMRIISVFRCDKKNANVFLRMQKRKKADENVYCLFQLFGYNLPIILLSVNYKYYAFTGII